ncbi:fibronectin type III domain-containing protein [Paenibacillus sp.]|uniref:fibronectin type III domain-containing protein n=1 Tax=Paenibacillus sp. TaxID=58172 RepID=UPI002D71CABE|nr:carbohydrate binding domain-containing protein [Paenibacillus sp.]HZG58672.1 carbohydrate binding domain-containing protein [Paenibacillus sp.]
MARLGKQTWTMWIRFALVVAVMSMSMTWNPPTASAATTFSNVSMNTTTPAMYDKFEMTFNLSTTYNNPFDPNEANVLATFTTPSGATEVVPAFYKSETAPNWAVRYSPRQTGVHSVVLTVQDANGTGTSSAYTFTAGSPGNNRGFMGVEGSRFVDSYGKQLTLIGTNFAWNDSGAGERAVENEIPNLKPAKMNLLRVWYTCWWSGLGPEWGPVTAHETGVVTEYEGIGRYQLYNQSKVDDILEAAEANDVYIMLTMNSFGDFYYQWYVNAYNQANGGPSTYTENNLSFWTDPVAKEYQKKLLRYMFARFGYSRALGMLEYWNESDNRVDTSAEIRAAWHSEMDAYWKSWDFYNHPTTTSYAWKDHVGQNHGSWETLPFLDATNAHRYDDSPNVIDNWQAQIEKLHNIGGNRPAFIGEVGRPQGDYATDPAIDEYMHNALWAPIFRAGAAGGSLWWFVEGTGFALPSALKAVHTRLADFVQPVEEHLIDMPHVDYGLQANGTKAGGFKSATRAYLWINDTQANHTVTNPRTVSGMTFTLPMTNGAYNVTFYNTYTGTYGTTTSVQATGGNLTISVPSFSRDIAVKIECQSCNSADTQAPTAPTNLASPAKTDTTVDLTWTASTDNVGVTGYEIYKDGAFAGSTTGATAYTATGLTANTTYSFTVKAKDAAGNTSAASQAINVTTNSSGGGGNLLQNPGFELDNGSGAPASWTCEQNYCSRDTAVKRSGTSSMKVDNVTGAWFGQYQTVTGTAGETYVFDGYVNITRNTGTKVNVDVQFLNGSNGLISSHRAASYNGTTTSGWERVQGTFAAPAGTAKVKVQVYYTDLNAAVYLDDFALTTQTASDTQAPTAPANLASPSKTDTTITLTWNASTDNVGVTGYEIYRGSALAGTTGGSTTTFTDAGLTANTSYSYTVKAKDAAGNVSASSSALSVTTNASPTNLLQNPGFELDNGSGVPASWTCEQNYCSRDTAVKRSGTSSMKVDNVTGAWFGQYQTVTGTAGKTYAFEGYVNITRNSGTKVNVDVHFLNSSDGTISSHAVAFYNGTTTSGWQHMQGSFTAPAGTAKVKVRVHYTDLNAAVYLDDFVLSSN